MSENCLKAQTLLYELKLDQVDNLMAAESKLDADNIAVDWVKESAIFLRIFISEDKVVYDKYSKEWTKLVKHVEGVQFNNAWLNLVLSDMHIHQAFIHLKFNESFSAGADIKAAFKYLKENKKKFPSFLPDNKNLGFLTCLFSSVPAKYQWLAKLIGFEGDMNEGLNEMNEYLKSNLNTREHIWMKLDAAFLYAMVQHHLNKSSDIAWASIEPLTRNYKAVVLENYMRATIANYVGKNEEMYTVLMAKPPYAGSTPFYYLDYLLGISKLRRLDTDADVHFKIFTVLYKGKSYLKSAYRYLSWAYQLKGDNKTALTYYAMCVKNGVALIEEDKQAEREAKEALPWPIELLKARVQYDGHYIDKALTALNSINASSLVHKKHKLELEYRKARIYHDLKQYNKAIPFYEITIEDGKKETYYYAAYSALQLGLIYELQGKKEQSKKYFNMAKNTFSANQEYVNSIEQKAKAGLKRLGK
ncbi:MAG: hypothetical protein IT245_05585 [Bacteroidia bacterium]|nr:hypothetical protein [Bacteroidia bacterium]